MLCPQADRERLQRSRSGLPQEDLCLLANLPLLVRLSFRFQANKTQLVETLGEKLFHVNGQFGIKLQRLSEFEGCHWMSTNPRLVLSLCWLHSLTVQMGTDSKLTPSKLSDPH